MKVLKLELSSSISQRHLIRCVKLTETGRSRNLLNLLRDFLNERKQRVVLSAQFSTWEIFQQDYILVPLLLLIYTNYLTEGLSSNPKVFAGYVFQKQPPRGVPKKRCSENI